MSTSKSYQGIDTKLFKVVYYKLLTISLSLFPWFLVYFPWWTPLTFDTVVYVDTYLQPRVTVFTSTSWCGIHDHGGSKCSLILGDYISEWVYSIWGLLEFLHHLEHVNRLSITLVDMCMSTTDYISRTRRDGWILIADSDSPWKTT